MALTNADNYSFNSHQAVLDFISPLILEGYPVAIQTVYQDLYWDKDRIDHYEVFIGEKKKPIKITIERKEEELEITHKIVPYEIRAAFEQGKTLEYKPRKWSEELGENEWKPFSKHTVVEDYRFNADEYEYRIKE